ncbi:MAG: hypothetical protein WA906_00320, partial [Pacificimonas sp.]
MLIGVSGGLDGDGAAFLELADGSQRRVPMGRTLDGVWTLSDLAPTIAVFTSASGTERRLALRDEDGRATASLPVDQVNENDTRDAIFT